MSSRRPNQAAPEKTDARRSAPPPGPRDGVARDAAEPARKLRKAETRERIRGAAEALFMERGFDETTTKAVAERAGVAAGTVFVHARDKVDLLNLVMFDRLTDATERAFETLPPGPLRAQLLHVFGGVIRMYGEAPALARPFVESLPSAKGPNADLVNALTFEFLGRLSALIEDAKARGEIAADVSSLALARNLFAIYFFTLVTWLGGFVSVEGIPPALADAFDLQLRGVAPG